MQINTRFNLGDEVFVLHKIHNNIQKVHVSGIEIFISDSIINITYIVFHKEDCTYVMYKDKDVFKNKEELNILISKS